MGRCGFAVVFVLGLGLSSVAFADASGSEAVKCPTFTHLWPEVPTDPSPSMEDQITDHLTELGNMLGGHMNVLSDHMLSLKVDGRHNSAKLHVGNGGEHFLRFNLDTDWLFAEGKAHVKAHLGLGLGKHELELKLPDMDVIPDNYHGQDLVQVNVSVLERRF